MISRADVGDKILFEKEPFLVGFASWDHPFQRFFPETVGGDMEEGRRLVESEGGHYPFSLIFTFSHASRTHASIVSQNSPSSSSESHVQPSSDRQTSTPERRSFPTRALMPPVIHSWTGMSMGWQGRRGRRSSTASSMRGRR